MNFNDSAGCVLCYCIKCLVNQHVKVTNYCYKLILPVFIIKPYIYIDSLWVLSFQSTNWQLLLVTWVPQQWQDTMSAILRRKDAGSSTMTRKLPCPNILLGIWPIFICISDCDVENRELLTLLSFCDNFRQFMLFSQIYCKLTQ